ncbi:uncharacterized protein LOC108910035 [Anoplophora glabripennis]|uniref:uncharacterized protein LOC108910035 n=1 Tax=Anoplophora glabripennis TaxID=217634 RepID=UPI00087592EA|nr:uncharacterized protein LOC108910035 [Anoplophora glabripennis]
MENRGVLSSYVERVEADSTTFPFHETGSAPARKWSSSWSDSTVTLYDLEMENCVDQEPDSTTSPKRSGSTTPPRMSRSTDDLSDNDDGQSLDSSQSTASDGLMLDGVDDRVEAWLSILVRVMQNVE